MESAPRKHKEAIGVWVGLRAGLVVAAGLCACGPPMEAKVNQNIQEVKQERDPAKLVARARGFANVGDLTRAEQYLLDALDNGGDPKEIMPILIRVCLASGRYRVALKRANEQLKRDPRNVPLRFLAGSLHMALDETQLAQDHLLQVVKDDPNHADAHYALAIIARDSHHDLTKSDYYFRQYLRLRPEGTHADEAREGLLKSVP